MLSFTCARVYSTVCLYVDKVLTAKRILLWCTRYLKCIEK